MTLSTDKIEQLLHIDSQNKDGVINQEIEEIRDIAHRITRVAKSSQNLINLLLTNLQQDLKSFPQTVLSMKDCINYMLNEFSFETNQYQKIYCNINNDFQFLGNLELVTHVFFNLLRNNLYFIKAAGKGEIYIMLDQTDQFNRIIFKDTGTGIHASQLSHLFKPFYSNRPHGTGIGLSFCKKVIENMKGKIHVQSILGQHTTFLIYLPKINDIVS